MKTASLVTGANASAAPHYFERAAISGGNLEHVCVCVRAGAHALLTTVTRSHSIAASPPDGPAQTHLKPCVKRSDEHTRFCLRIINGALSKYVYKHIQHSSHAIYIQAQ